MVSVPMGNLTVLVRPWLVSTKLVPKECAGRGAKVVSFVSLVALVCDGLKLFHELDIVLENLPATLLRLTEYIHNEVDLGRREKAEGLLDDLLHPLFKFDYGLCR